MLTKEARILLENPPSGYPLIAAASAATKKCGVCPNKQAKAVQLLRIAVLKYMDDPKFIEYCKTLFPVPTVICGIYIK